MTVRSLSVLFAMATAAVGLNAPLMAADPYPLPAGFERFMFPDTKFSIDERVDVWADYVGTWSSEFGEKGTRPIDVEIEWYDPKPNTKNINDAVWQNVTVVSVPNEGPFQSSGWVLDVASSSKTIDVSEADQEMRPIDIDCYFRRDPYSGKIEATYAVIWVANSKHHYSPWEWIPAMPYDAFMNLLNEKRNKEFMRPYDIDFAVDDNGQVVGTALLAPVLMSDTLTGDPETDFYAVPTMWCWFNPGPTTLLGFADDGWKLADVEVPMSGLKGGPFGSVMAEFEQLGWRFGLFVNTQFVEENQSFAGLMTDDETLDVPPLARIFDLERDGTWTGEPDDSYYEQAPIPLYTHAFLLPGE
jgi:hypothetical protein